MSTARTAFALAALLAVCASPAVAASSLTARASGVLAVYAQPGYAGFGTLLDKLRPNERVHVLSCTHQQRWCEIEQLDGGPSGWVDGSYLVGSPAKNAVTPFEFSFDPMDPLDLRHRHR